MRLSRLALDRYGKFTDAAIDFGPAPRDGPDLHIVYGPNEAGKTTVLNACLDLFFGIEPRTRYAFLHPYGAMRIGAEVETEAGPRSLVRVKGQKGTLLGPDDRPVDPGPLAAAVGGLDREGYRAMFSLDEATLEEGGESILASRGELGRLLFGASAGLTEIDARLSALRAEIEAFHRPKARKGALAEARRRLEELRRERRDIDVTAAAHARAVADRKAAAEGVEETAAARAEIAAARETLRTRLAALPRRDRLARLRARIAALGELPRPPAGFADDLPRLMREETTLATDLRHARDRLARVDEGLGALAPDEAALALGDRIDALGGTEDGAPGLEARAATAEDDIPRKRTERAEAEAAIAALRTRLGVPEEVGSAALVLPAARLGTVREAIARHAGLAAALESARHEARMAEAALARAGEGAGTPTLRDSGTAVAGDSENPGKPHGKDAAADIPPDPGALAELAAAHEAALSSDHATRRTMARRRTAALDARLAERMGPLHPWSGTAEALAALPVPGPARLARWQQALAPALRRAETAAETRARAVRERERLADERDRLKARAAGIDDLAAAEIRAVRNAAWASHRNALDRETADRFEEAMTADDRMGAERLARATDLAALAEAEAALARAEADVRAAEAEREAAQQACQALGREIAEAVAALAPDQGTGLPADTGLAALTDWLAARERAVETLTEREEARLAEREAEAEEAGLAERLRQAMAPLAPVPQDAGLEATVARAGALLEASEERARVEAEAERARARLAEAAAERRVALAEAEAAMEGWREDWARALEGTWLARGAERDKGPAAVSRALDEAAELPALLATRDDLDRRIAAMEADREAYGAEVSAIAAALGGDGEAGRPRALAAHLRARLAQARREAERRQDLLAEREEASDTLSRLEEAGQRLDARRRAITAMLGVADLTEAAERLKAIAERDALEAQVAEEEQALAAALGTAEAAGAEALLAGADPAALEAEAARLDAELAAREESLQERIAARTRAEDALAAIGADDRVARLDLAIRTELLGIEADARTHLASLLGLKAVERALAAYRDRHRSEMLETASQAFARVTGGAWAGLATMPGDELIAVLPERRGGGSARAGELSKGTRFQLYLALRAAAYHGYAAQRPPPPFLGDDIFETFDDDRTGAAFALLAGMAGKGQVVYLTHHAHLVEIAREVCPGVRVHSLPGETAADAETLVPRIPPV